MLPKGKPQEGGILYPPTSSGKKYISLYKHRDSARSNRILPSIADKSRQPSCWCLSPEDEYGLFCISDESGWRGKSGHYWGILTNRRPVGTKGERIAKFPAVRTANVPWHGYPACPAKYGEADTPSSNVIKKWERENLITPSEGHRIARMKMV